MKKIINDFFKFADFQNDDKNLLFIPFFLSLSITLYSYNFDLYSQVFYILCTFILCPVITNFFIVGFFNIWVYKKLVKTYHLLSLASANEQLMIDMGIRDLLFGNSNTYYAKYAANKINEL